MKIYYYTGENKRRYFSKKRDAERSRGKCLLYREEVSDILSVDIKSGLALSFLIRELNKNGSEDFFYDVMKKEQLNETFE